MHHGDRQCGTDLFPEPLERIGIVPCTPELGSHQMPLLVTLPGNALPDSGRAPLPETQPDRDHGRTPERVGAHGDSLRQSPAMFLSAIVFAATERFQS